MIGYFNLVNNLNNYVNYYFIIIIVPEKPLWGGSIKYVCSMYVDELFKRTEHLVQQSVECMLKQILKPFKRDFSKNRPL